MITKKQVAKLEEKLQKEKEKNRELGHRYAELNAELREKETQLQECCDLLLEGSRLLIEMEEIVDDTEARHARLVDILFMYLDRDASKALGALS